MAFQSKELKDNPYTIKPIHELVGLDSEKEKLQKYVEGKNICFVQGQAGKQVLSKDKINCSFLKLLKKDNEWFLYSLEEQKTL